MVQSLYILFTPPILAPIIFQFSTLFRCSQKKQIRLPCSIIERAWGNPQRFSRKEIHGDVWKVDLANYALDHLRIINFYQIYHRPPGKQTNDKLEKSKIINELTYFPIENLGDDQASHASFQGCTLLINGRK